MSSRKSQEVALENLRKGQNPESLASFEHLKQIVGFPEYRETEGRYAT